ncbi:S1 family peptidase [Psychrobacillus antarcticus]|uniref:S1 family peptidase n=1 Tax=Psychrobacillus antarcticus TaxID=2879115 RepID=UPI002407C6FB|nr:serine protease [Psychrobacillus antarcticus]
MDCTVRIEGKLSNGETTVGTGFFVIHEKETSSKLFLVTNKHVINGIVDGFVLVKNKNSNDTDISKKDIQINFSEKDFFGHPNPNIDVAISNVSGHFNKISESGLEPNYSRLILETMIPNTEQITEHIDAIEDIIFIGYPSGLWDSVNNLPIVRKGITATPFHVDFMGDKVFLIDASVFPGSSGSPVFSYANGSYTGRTGQNYTGQKVLFLGIVARVYHRTEHGQILLKDIPTNHSSLYTEVKQMLDLGVVYKSSTVLETIDSYLNKVQKSTLI